MLSVCTSSTQDSLTTLEAVQEILGAPASDEALLERLIVRASRWAEGYVGQPLLAQTYWESVAGTASQSLLLDRTPVRSVAKVVYGSSSTADGTVLTSTEYTVEEPDAGILRRQAGFLWQPARPAEVAEYVAPGTDEPNYWVEYSAGYLFPGDESTGPDLPEDIENAVIEKTIALYRREPDVLSKRMGEFAVTFDPNRLDPAESLLEPYRRLA